jgi:hypothetical protein
MFFINSNTGWITTSAIFKTTNGGLNWNQYQGNEIGREYTFATINSGWASQEEFRIAKTTNSGLNWFYQTSPIYNNLSISSADSLKAWAGGSGLVRTTDGGGTTGINNNTKMIPSNFILYQNYPNPFNPNTVISYQLTVSSYVELKVYDISGNELKTLVGKKQNAGEYKIDFVGSGLSSGVYFYKLEVYDDKSNQVFSETKKMILVK